MRDLNKINIGNGDVYLEKILKEEDNPKQDKEIEIWNQLRQYIKAIFQKRGLFGFTKPLDGHEEIIEQEIEAFKQLALEVSENKFINGQPV